MEYCNKTQIAYIFPMSSSRHNIPEMASTEILLCVYRVIMPILRSIELMAILFYE